MKQEEITDQDIKLFRRSLLARRMPGLKNLSDEEVKGILAADEAGVIARRAAVLEKSWPKTKFQRGQRPQIVDDGVFRPVSPSVAKSETARPTDERHYLNLGTPYESEHSAFVADQNQDRSLRCSDSDWVPSGGNSRAKDTIKTKSNLNISSHIYDT